MFHLVSGVMHQASELEDEEPLAIASLDVKNAFNTLSRAKLAKAILHCCWNKDQSNLTSQAQLEPLNMGYDILWKHFQGHYGCKGVLKFYHNGTTYKILSETGVQQGDPLGSVLFALGNHSSLIDIASLNQTLLVVAYADNIFLLGPLQDVSRAIPVFKQTLEEANLQLNTLESELHIPRWANLDMATLQQRQCVIQ